jgi:hypothetical protein
MPIEHPTVSCCSARSSQQSCWSRSGSEPNATSRAWPGQSAHLLCHSGRRGSRRLPFRERTKGSACVAYRGARPGRLRVVGGVAAVARTRRRTSQRPAPGARLAGADMAAARRCLLPRQGQQEAADPSQSQRTNRARDGTCLGAPNLGRPRPDTGTNTRQLCLRYRHRCPDM